MNRSFLIAFIAAPLVVCPLAAAELPAAWQHFQTIRLNQAGLLRLDLPVATLDAAQADLRDVRLFDDTGREVPFLLERTAPQRPASRPAAAFKSSLSGDATVVTITTGPPQPLQAVTLETPAPDFLKAVTIEGSADGRSWTRLASGELFFRQFGASRLQLPLDGRAWPQLRLTLDNRRSPPIPITGARVHPAPVEQVPRHPLGVEIVEREEAGQQTRLTLRLAAANATLGTLTLQTPEPLFTRAASLVLRQVSENEITETVLARDTIFRLAANDTARAEDLALDAGVVVPAREVVLVIDNGDSPPLPVTGLRADAWPVALMFHAGESRVFHLLSGNPSAPAPRYDLAALRGQLKPTAITAPDTAPLASNPAWRAPEALPGVELVGTAIDLAGWAFRKPVTLAAAGVQQLELDLEVLAHTARSFADLRLVREGMQLPYLLDRTPIERKFSPGATRVTDPKRPSVSLWELQLPHHDLPLSRLECATTATLFQRSAMLTEEQRDDRGNTHRVRLGAAEWVRAPGQKVGRLSVQFLQAPRTDRVRLEVENGDNPPLELTDFTCWHPATRVLFKADAAADTFLYYGNPAAHAARYDLSLVARQLLAADKARAALGAELALKKVRGGSSTEPGGAGSWIFWAVLGAVVVALLVVLAKLLPKPPAG
jgi:hypothetical protein